MKALVLAGEGTRPRPSSYAMPKQLIPVANRPVLEHVVENVTYLGVREIGVIVGEWAPEIARLLGDAPGHLRRELSASGLIVLADKGYSGPESTCTSPGPEQARLLQRCQPRSRPALLYPGNWPGFSDITDAGTTSYPRSPISGRS